MDQNIRTIGVIGAGQMGSGIAQVAAHAGFKVRLYDVSREQLIEAWSGIEKSLGKLEAKGKISEEAHKATIKNLKVTSEWSDLKECDFCIEAVPEDFNVKKIIFKELERLIPSEVILATNTSSIPIANLAAVTKRPDKVIGMHFMNPAALMECVEVIRAPSTSDATHQVTLELAKKFGKTPVTVKDSPGFVVNRILLPMLNEAIEALEEGLATKEDIDLAMKISCNFPMGPLTLADFVGLDTCLFILEVMGRKPAPLLKNMVAEGKLGKKSGEGFYKY